MRMIRMVLAICTVAGAVSCMAKPNRTHDRPPEPPGEFESDDEDRPPEPPGGFKGNVAGRPPKPPVEAGSSYRGAVNRGGKGKRAKIIVKPGAKLDMTKDSVATVVR